MVGIVIMMMTLYTDDGQVIIIMYTYVRCGKFCFQRTNFQWESWSRNGQGYYWVGWNWATVGRLQFQTNQKRLKLLLIFSSGSPRVKSCLSSHVRSSERGKASKHCNCSILGACSLQNTLCNHMYVCCTNH